MNKQINLLPSLKQERLQEVRMRRIIVGTATAILILSIALPLILLLTRSGQSIVLNRVQKGIDDKLTQLRETENITTILSAQDHLDALPDLYHQRLLVSQLFKILPSVIPQEVSLSDLQIAADGTITFSGTANSYTAVEKFYNGLILADVNDFNIERAEPNPAVNGHFTDLVLENVSGLTGREIGFTISGRFDQTILQLGANDGQN